MATARSALRQIKAEQLEASLARGLERAYIVAGDEPLLLLEAAAAIRKAARSQGASDREVFHLDGSFDWNDFLATARAMGLFSQRRILELRGTGGKWTQEAIAALQDYAAYPDPDAVLLLTWPEWGKAVENTPWVQALAPIAVAVPIWPVRVTDLPRWLQQRAQQRGLRLVGDAASLLAERVEGHLLAAAQALDQLALVADGRPLDATLVAELTADSARFDMFQLAEAVLCGDGVRALRILRALRAEGEDPIPAFNWLLTQIETVRTAAVAVDEGATPAMACTRAGVRDWHQQPFLRALQRGDWRVWEQRLEEAGEVDLGLKGRGNGNAWVHLERWLLRCSLPAQHRQRFQPVR